MATVIQLWVNLLTTLTLLTHSKNVFPPKIEEDFSPDEIQEHIEFYQSKFGKLSGIELIKLRKEQKEKFQNRGKKIALDLCLQYVLITYI